MHDGCNCYFSFWAIFYTFASLTAWKMKISKNWEKYLEISSFYTNLPKIMITGYTVPEIWRIDVIIFLGYFLPFYSQKNENVKKIKKHLKISSFYTSVPKLMIIGYTAPEIWCMADVIIFHFRLYFALLSP